MRQLLIFGMIFAILISAAACGTGTGTEGDKVDIRGQITNITPAGSGATDSLGTILIEGEIEPDTSYDRASVRITSNTRITRVTGDSTVAATFEDLRVGQQVEAEFTGPVAESYPVQATAGRLVILE